MDADIDKVIFKQLLTAKKNIPLFTEALKEKYFYFAREIKDDNFSAYVGWVNCWMDDLFSHFFEKGFKRGELLHHQF